MNDTRNEFVDDVMWIFDKEAERSMNLTCHRRAVSMCFLLMYLMDISKYQYPKFFIKLDRIVQYT